jgi:hypothetical protein
MTTPNPSEGGESFPSFGGAGVVKNKLQSPKNSTDILQNKNISMRRLSKEGNKVGILFVFGLLRLLC